MNKELITNGLNRWIEIELSAITHNFQEIRKKVPDRIKIGCVVKSNAYGLGAIEISKTLAANQADMLMVSNIEEGVELRKAGLTTPILVFAAMLPTEAALMKQWQLIPTIDNMTALHSLDHQEFHLKIDTGMSRLGLLPADAVALAQEAAENSQGILTGVYTHLATAMNKNKQAAYQQIAIFQDCLAQLKAAGITGFIAHAANSAAILSMDLNKVGFDMVRCGTLLYGQTTAVASEKWDLMDPCKVQAKIISTHQIAKGAKVGYSGQFTAPKKMLIGTISLGYGDGFTMADSKKNCLTNIIKQAAYNLARLILKRPGADRIIFNNRTLPIIGKVSMQMTTVDLSTTPLQPGDLVEIKMRRVPMNPRLSRIYLEQGKPVACYSLLATSAEKIQLS